MSDQKTHATGESVTAFLRSVEDPRRRQDCRDVMSIMRQVTGNRPRMWGPSIIGYGRYHYRYASGREGDWFLTGLSPRKRDLSVYVMPDLGGHEELLSALGTFRRGVCCLYVKRLEQVDQDVLRELLKRSVARVRMLYDGT